MPFPSQYVLDLKSTSFFNVFKTFQNYVLEYATAPVEHGVKRNILDTLMPKPLRQVLTSSFFRNVLKKPVLT